MYKGNIDITAFLDIGEQNAIHLYKLAELTHLDTNSVKRQIQIQRRNGVEIISTHKGYFISPDKETTARFINDLKYQGIERIVTAREMAKNSKNLGQQSLINE